MFGYHAPTNEENETMGRLIPVRFADKTGKSPLLTDKETGKYMRRCRLDYIEICFFQDGHDNTGIYSRFDTKERRNHRSRGWFGARVVNNQATFKQRL